MLTLFMVTLKWTTIIPVTILPHAADHLSFMTYLMYMMKLQVIKQSRIFHLYIKIWIQNFMATYFSSVTLIIICFLLFCQFMCPWGVPQRERKAKRYIKGVSQREWESKCVYHSEFTTSIPLKWTWTNYVIQAACAVSGLDLRIINCCEGVIHYLYVQYIQLLSFPISPNMTRSKLENMIKRNIRNYSNFVHLVLINVS